jgi:hypothetical protein
MRNTTGAVLILLILAAAPPDHVLTGRGTHSLRGHATRGGAGTFAGDGHHADDASTKAAAEQEDRLLDNKLKSICRGC